MIYVHMYEWAYYEHICMCVYNGNSIWNNGHLLNMFLFSCYQFYLLHIYANAFQNKSGCSTEIYYTKMYSIMKCQRDGFNKIPFVWTDAPVVPCLAELATGPQIQQQHVNLTLVCSFLFHLKDYLKPSPFLIYSHSLHGSQHLLWRVCRYEQ